MPSPLSFLTRWRWRRYTARVPGRMAGTRYRMRIRPESSSWSARFWMASGPTISAAARIADLVADLVTGPPSLRACAGLHAALAGQPTLQVADGLGGQVRRRGL